MNKTEQATLTRVQIREILRRNKGSITDISKRLGHTSHVTVSKWLSGKETSQPVKDMATKKALELLEQEAAS